ncbi:unnamed protein product [Didymodactylos carnosus]|uniref:G-protein coupled receptors family 1 profile domain-containing protein n=1 Tax=Didymodactylos carnosus TaxID=1234261 RepID=A0A814B694_9BILA|nr:unnamed protein product [Didymodactylos carnosus]CAF1183196.1 unnamed protein product [Didymodactylos carnosus]CAF3702769.1 unnamed protein product [Didymodactylos carnosus]CAF3994484.1 unnamed protein product [Didymodactylos carnosus]
MNSTAPTIGSLTYVYVQLRRYWMPILLALGTTSSVSNVVIFTRKTLRTSPCSMYFLAATINNSFVQYTLFLNMIITDAINDDPTTYSSAYCKIRSYLIYVLYTLSPYFTVLACADRYCSSSSNSRLRNLSKLSIAGRLILLTTTFTFLIYLHVLFNFEIHNGACGPKDSIYAEELTIMLMFSFCLLPPAIMSIFSVLAFRNIKQQRQRIMPVNAVGGARMRQRESQLLKMLFFHVLVNILLVTPFSIAYLMSTIYYELYINSIFSFIFNTLMLVMYLNYATSFFIYIATTRLYRHEFIKVLKILKNHFCRMPLIQQHFPQQRQDNGTTRHTTRTNSLQKLVILRTTICGVHENRSVT